MDVTTLGTNELDIDIRHQNFCSRPLTVSALEEQTRCAPPVLDRRCQTLATIGQNSKPYIIMTLGRMIDGFKNRACRHLEHKQQYVSF